MKTVTRLVLLVSLLALVSATAIASPLNWFSESQADAAAYDLTISYLGQDGSGYYGYEWDVTFNGTVLLPSPQHMKAFTVFDEYAAFQYSVSDPTGWENPKTPSGAGDMVVEWNAASSSYFVAEDGAITFQGWFDQALVDPDFHTAIHVGSDPDSAWVNHTPELPPSALLSLSMLPLGLAYIRGRRRKQS